MQAPTHILTGVLIEKLVNKNMHSKVDPMIIGGTGVIAHILLDKVARLTYHPPDALWDDPFWVVYHASILATTLVMLKVYWKDYRFGILTSIFPDIDWIIFRPITTLFSSLEVLKGPVTHRALESLLSLIMPLQLFDSLPNWNSKQFTIVIEGAIIAILIYTIRCIGSPKSQINLKA